MNRRLALLLTSGAAVAGGLVAAAPANAWTNTVPCPTASSGDVCWNNYDVARPVAYQNVDSEYHRDQVCTKARDGLTTGAVSAGSVCGTGTNNYHTWFASPSTPKKAYGYWAGNGGVIWVRSQAST